MSDNESNTSAASPSEQPAPPPLELTSTNGVKELPPAVPTQQPDPQPQPEQPEPQPQAKSGPQEFPPLTLDLALSPTAHARIQVTGFEGRGWTLQDFARLIAFLELQRSFLADEPLNVHVAVTSALPPSRT